MWNVWMQGWLKIPNSKIPNPKEITNPKLQIPKGGAGRRLTGWKPVPTQIGAAAARRQTCGIFLARLPRGGFIHPQMKYRITLVEEPEGGWSVWCDDLRGCASQGETREEAIENIRIAIREYLESLDDGFIGENDSPVMQREVVLV